MGFTIYSAGSGDKECLQYKREHNVNQLLSQLNERKEILSWVEYFKTHPECKSKLFIDSGAFSAHTKGKEVDVDDYIRFINSIDDYVYIFAQVDKIPGRFRQPKTAEELAAAPKESWDNYLYMKDKVKSRDKLLPIFHQGEDFKWLHNILNYKHEDGTGIKYCGISPANDVSVTEKQKWCEQVFKIIAQSPNPNIQTHAFGMTSLNVLEQYPFTSADSTSWLLSGANGSILLEGKTLCVSDRRLHDNNNVLNKAFGIKEDIQKKIEALGFNLDELSKDATKRQIFNLASLEKWSKDYKYRGTCQYKESLF